MTPKITIQYKLEFYESVFSPEYYDTLEELRRAKERKIFEYHSPNYNEHMSKEDRLYWIKHYNETTIKRIIIIEDKVIN